MKPTCTQQNASDETAKSVVNIDDSALESDCDRVRMIVSAELGNDNDVSYVSLNGVFRIRKLGCPNFIGVSSRDVA
jgi:hypothetical protein